MKIIKNLQDYHQKTPLALSIGMFDGVHLGHQSIINQLINVCKLKSLETGLLTFWPHPRTIFSPNDDLKLLNTIEEKTYFLEKHGVQHLFLKEFDPAFRNLSGEEFVKQILIEKLNVKYLIIGHDHTFGKDKSGDFALLEKMAPEFGFEVQQVEAVDFHEKHISSTQIRNALSAGNVKEANEMLGYVYSVSGKVIHGKKIGRTIGYPTANIEVNSMKLLPKKGAYIVDVFVKDQHLKGMLSIGTNPTVSGNELSVEVYILDFDGDIYDEDISVNFREFLHEEIKFENLEKLIERLDEDKIRTENFNF
ncbi:bifunctional riboflavin kinase/FAD synthetase [Kaistella sp. G5-32]|uniref:Riboflavin biosynthesis protein n=1 Tax=Kaistella gelatinilytica TaxID=2787636 RepID=A0ABS0F9G6_9FLAO|nr:bifunctional riboflavin kinase/FAD synthetase [Kaistella gelatinilytica]MBF8456354.1 bifunctional riboflavin kinase/FAD synthetase [Kaistella gelatinilytica]